MTTLVKEVLHKLYLEELKTDVEIADILGCCKQSVYLARKRFGIKAKARWERKTCQPSTTQRQIIMGSLLGDASVSNGVKNGGPCKSVVEFKQGPRQRDYLFWKYEELQNLTTKEPSSVSEGQWRFRTFHHPFFSDLRKEWYPNGHKCVPLSAKALNLLGLAVWYMDDGGICSRNHVKFATCCFSSEDHNLLSWILCNNFGIESEMKIYSGYPVTVVRLGYRKKFFDLIRPYVLPSLLYKLDLGEGYV